MIVYYKKSFYTTVLERLIFNGSYYCQKKALNLMQHFVKLEIMRIHSKSSTGSILRFVEPFRLNNFLDGVSSLVNSSNSIIF